MKFVVVVLFLLTASFQLQARRCTGSSNCSACTSCQYCQHCNSGGSCGVCSHGSNSNQHSIKTLPPPPVYQPVKEPTNNTSTQLDSSYPTNSNTPVQQNSTYPTSTNTTTQSDKGIAGTVIFCCVILLMIYWRFKK
jgi:hypothetical protein